MYHQQGQYSQIILANNTSLKAISAEESLELRGRSIREAGQGVEDDLAWRYTSQDGHQDVHVFGQLDLCLVH